VGADKVILKQAISELLTQARVEELEKLSKSKWADLAYDIPFYLKDRLTELRKVKQMAISTEAKIEASKCQDCGEVNYPEWTLLPHERFNKICPNGAGLLCLSCFAKRLINKPASSSSSEEQIKRVAKFINGLSPHNLHRGVEAISELVSRERALGGKNELNELNLQIAKNGWHKENAYKMFPYILNRIEALRKGSE